MLRQLVISIIAGLACSFWAPRACALDPGRTMAQYMSDQWGIDRGFPAGSVTAITQTRDGYLWIGTDKGLIRFDGSVFHEFPQATPTTFSIGAVQQLVVDGDGGLWVLLQSTKVLRYYNGKFELGREEAEFGITSVSRQRDGMVLLSSLAYGALEYHAGKYQSLTPTAYSTNPSAKQTTATSDDLSSRLSWATGVATHRFAEPNSAVISTAETPDGITWLGTRDKGLFYISKGRVFPSGMKLPDLKINCLLLGERESYGSGRTKALHIGMEPKSHWKESRPHFFTARFLA